MATKYSTNRKHRLFIVAIPVLALALAADAAPVCTYNNASTSFGATYANNQQTSATAVACTAGSPSTAGRLNDTSYARTVITAPNTGDFKFLMRNPNQSNSVPTFEMISSLSPDTKAFPDQSIQAPSGGGCNDAGVTTGVAAIERHLHRSWPLFGKTYYYGDYIANPPNDPATVTLVTSPYTKWAPYNETQEYLYMDPSNVPGGTQAYAWGPHPSGGVTADQMHPLMDPGRTVGTGCAAQGLTGTDLTSCNTCLTTKGYYLKDGAVAGDLMKSVFTGAILNDFPPAWVHLAWGFGYVLDFQLKDAANNPLFQVVRDQYQSNNSVACPSAPNIVHAGGSYEPVGSSNCGIAYPTYNWASIQALGMGPVTNDLQNMEGGNNAWASAASFSGTVTAPSTPAGDMLQASNALQDFTTNTCKFCQPKAILYIGFGVPCAEDKPTGLPTTTLNPACTGECNYTNPASQCRCGANTNTNWLPQTASYLYNNLGIRSYFLGMGAHTAAMRRAASEGHGKYFDASDVASFHDGLVTILVDIINIASSSATSTVNAVQVNVAGQQELVPRFVADSTEGVWEGHLYKYYLFSEFAANCSKAGDVVPVPNAQQTVCNATCVCPGGSCSARWLIDSQCKLLTPDSSGFLYQATWNGSALVLPTAASCTTNADCGGLTCNTVTKKCPPPNVPAAVPVWDANDLMRSVNWYQRPVYTAIDSNGDGKIDASDGDGTSPAGMYKITASATAGTSNMGGGVTDAVADALTPYLAIDGTPTCSNIEAKLGITLGTPRLRACARVILNYALGEDLYNEQLLQSTDPNYRIGNRLRMLGDIFHSSPQDTGPPVSEADCGLTTRRCVNTLFNGVNTNGSPNYQPLGHPPNVVDPATGSLGPNSKNIDAYQAYYQNETFGLKRPQVAMFGANDGMVHAVQTACFVNTSTVNGVVMPNYWDGPGTGSCISGSKANGSELWAFIPPDLLPKLGLMVQGKHLFFADNSPMVRDIYAPSGTPSSTKRYTQDAAPSPVLDFKRIAIMGEREGGTHWFGLDVTDPTAPQFRWIFPQPNTEEELAVGQSWGDWVPNAPPIVPVRLAAPTAGTGYPTYTDSTGTPVAFQEKWVVLLPGGYDPYGIVGKHIYMLDAYMGTKLFQTNDFSGIKQDFSFAALPAAIPWGTQAVNSGTPTWNNGFFDTAVYGDMGGQVWTLRFNDVGTLNANGLVNNWFFARSFREAGGDDMGVSPYKMQHRTPFFAMASAARLDTGTLRAFIGSGDRANAAESGVGQCSIYNPLACGKLKCVMTMAENASINGNPSVGGVTSYQGDINATYATSWSGTFTSGSTAACSPSYQEVNACVSCAGGTSAATPASPGEPQYACTNTSSGWKCGVVTISDTASGQRLEVSTTTPNPNPNSDIGYYSRFLALNLFDNATSNPRSLFTSASTATTYDGRALTEAAAGTAPGGIPAGTIPNLFYNTTSKSFSAAGNTTVSATVNGNSPGYYFYYPVLDERTATNSVVAQNCVTWYSMEPGQPCNADADCSAGTCNTTTHTCVAPTACGSGATTIPARSAFLYQINATDGSSNCGLTSSSYLRTGAPLNAFLVPPPPPQQLVSQNAKGQLQYSIIAPVGQLSPPAAAGSGGVNTPFSFFYTIGLPRELETCRHQYQANACWP